MALTKPFDSLNHELLLTKLSLLNCVGCVVKWVIGFVGCVGPWLRGLHGSKIFYVGQHATWAIILRGLRGSISLRGSTFFA